MRSTRFIWKRYKDFLIALALGLGRPTRENFYTCRLQITYRWQHLNVKTPSCRQVLFNWEFAVYVFIGFSSSKTQDFDTSGENVFKPQISTWQTFKIGITISSSIGTYVVWERDNYFWRKGTWRSCLRIDIKYSTAFRNHSSFLKHGWI